MRPLPFIASCAVENCDGLTVTCRARGNQLAIYVELLYTMAGEPWWTPPAIVGGARRARALFAPAPRL
jgi:hypothetical protein